MLRQPREKQMDYYYTQLLGKNWQKQFEQVRAPRSQPTSSLAPPPLYQPPSCPPHTASYQHPTKPQP
jgi:hypothetical protein